MLICAALWCAVMGTEDRVVLAQFLSANNDVASDFWTFMRRSRARARTTVNASMTISIAQMAQGGMSWTIEAPRSGAALASPFLGS